MNLKVDGFTVVMATSLKVDCAVGWHRRGKEKKRRLRSRICDERRIELMLMVSVGRGLVKVKCDATGERGKSSRAFIRGVITRRRCNKEKP